MKGFKIEIAKWMPFTEKNSMIIGAVLVGWVLLSGPMSGMIAGLPPIPSPEAALGGIPAGELGVTTQQVSDTTLAGCAVSSELQGKAATVTFHTHDMEAANPYATEVDFTTNCWIYKNGNAPENYVVATTDTSNAEQSSGIVVGDTINVYCGGTTYYGEKIENHCVKNQDDILNIKAHSIDAETDIALTGYDETGSAGLTAAGNTTTADYDITLGANEEKDFYVQVKVNSADASLNLAGFATAATNDIDYVMPTSDEGLTKRTDVNFLEDVQISENDLNPSNNQTSDYTAYTFGAEGAVQPVLFSEWDYKKYHFKIASNAGNPSATDNVFSTIDAGIVCVLDATYAKGADGKIHLDYFDHGTANSESNVGITETFHDPVGKNSCMVIEGN